MQIKEGLADSLVETEAAFSFLLLVIRLIAASTLADQGLDFLKQAFSVIRNYDALA